MTARLVVSVSGLDGCPLDAPTGLAAELDRRGVPMSLLITPKRLRTAPSHRAVADWLRERAARGDALLLRGTDALDGARRPSRLARSARWPAGLAVLPAHETRLHLIGARAILTGLGLRVTGFAPPGWLVPAGTLDVVRQHGFVVCAELRGVRDLRTDVLLPGRVLGPGMAPWAGERTEPWWCRAMVLGAARAARHGRLVRLAVPAADLARPGITSAVLDAVDLAVHHGAEPTTYEGLVATSPLLPGPRRGDPPQPAAARTADQSSTESPRGRTDTSVPFGAVLVNKP